MVTAGVSFYNFVVFVHVMAILVAFGGVFAYPIWLKVARERGGRDFAYAFESLSRIGKGVIGPASVLALAAGIYLVADGDWDIGGNLWLELPILILVALVIAGPTYFSRTEEKLSELAQRDAKGSTGEVVAFTPEYDRLERQFKTVLRVSSAAVALSVFLMTTKPF